MNQSRMTTAPKPVPEGEEQPPSALLMCEPYGGDLCAIALPLVTSMTYYENERFTMVCLGAGDRVRVQAPGYEDLLEAWAQCYE